MGIQWCFDAVLKVCFQCVSIGVSRLFQGFFKKVLRMLQGRSRGVPRDL